MHDCFVFLDEVYVRMRLGSSLFQFFEYSRQNIQSQNRGSAPYIIQRLIKIVSDAPWCIVLRCKIKHIRFCVFFCYANNWTQYVFVYCFLDRVVKRQFIVRIVKICLYNYDLFKSCNIFLYLSV